MSKNDQSLSNKLRHAALDARNAKRFWGHGPSCYHDTILLAAADNIDELNATILHLAMEFAKAVHEPNYNYTREEWKTKALDAEARLNRVKTEFCKIVGKDCSDA